MVVCLSVKPHMATRQEAMTLAREKRMMTQAKFEMFNTPEDYELEETGEYAEARLDLMRSAPCLSDIETVVQQVSCGQWNQIVLPREHFKRAVKKIWSVCRNNLPLEEQILCCLQLDGNGGLSVESILSRLLAAGSVARFGAVRDALGHLCKLYLVEHCYGQFSIREGMLKG